MDTVIFYKNNEIRHVNKCINILYSDMEEYILNDKKKHVDNYQEIIPQEILMGNK